MSAANPSTCTGIIPHLVLSSSKDAIAFYKNAFGAEQLTCMTEPQGERVMHACIKIGEQFVFLADDFPEYCDGAQQTPQALGGTSVTLHRHVPDCDAAYQQAVDAGATPRMPPADMFWGDRYAVVVDPFGHSWSFATHQRDMTPAEIEQAMADAFQQGPQDAK